MELSGLLPGNGGTKKNNDEKIFTVYPNNPNTHNHGKLSCMGA